MIDTKLIIDCYTKDRTSLPSMNRMITSFDQFFSKDALKPEFLGLEQKNKFSTASSVQDTVSFCSTLSRVKVNRVLYKEILINREEHSIFVDLE